MQYFIIVVADESELEPILGWVNRNCPRAGAAIQTVDGFSLHSSEIDWLVECSNDAVISIVIDGLMNN